MKHVNSAENVKGFIGFRIVILFVFIFVALLGGSIYFGLIPVQINGYNFGSDSKDGVFDGEGADREFINSFESGNSTSPSLRKDDLTDIYSLLDAGTLVTGIITGVDSTSGTMDIKLESGDLYTLRTYSFSDYLLRVSFETSTSSNRVLVLSANTNSEVPVLTKVFASDIATALNKQVSIKYYDDQSYQLKKVVKFVGVFFNE